MLKLMGILETAQTLEVPLLQPLPGNSGIWHHIPESLQHLLLKAWLFSCTTSVKQKKGKRWIPIHKKATSSAFNPTMLTLCIDIQTNDYLIHDVQFQKCRLQLLWIFYLIPLLLAFLLHYWHPPTEEYLMCSFKWNSHLAFYLMTVGLCTSNNIFLTCKWFTIT